MTEDKIITLRFKTSSVPDMELYRKLECERNCLGVSMPVCVKGILRDHYAENSCGDMEKDMQWMRDELEQYQKQLQLMVREELMSLSAVLLATLVRMNGTEPENGTANSGKISHDSEEPSNDNLPEYSDELPEGFDDILGKMM